MTAAVFDVHGPGGKAMGLGRKQGVTQAQITIATGGEHRVVVKSRDAEARIMRVEAFEV